MRIEFDPDKDADNRDKHDVALDFGAEVLADTNRLDILDVRFELRRGTDRHLRHDGGSGMGLRFCPTR